MARLSIDLTDKQGRELLNKDKRTIVSDGCLEALRRLGKYGNLVKAIRVVQQELKDPLSEVKVTIHYSDPAGREDKHEFFYPFQRNASASDFADAMCQSDFLKKLHAHIESGHSRHCATGNEFAKYR